jgi:hypothetical protein
VEDDLGGRRKNFGGRDPGALGTEVNPDIIAEASLALVALRRAL